MTKEQEKVFGDIDRFLTARYRRTNRDMPWYEFYSILEKFERYLPARELKEVGVALTKKWYPGTSLEKGLFPELK